MSPIEEIKNRNEQDWSKIILKAQIQQLRRERYHLKSKSQERVLTFWERMRLSEVVAELKDTIREVGHLCEFSHDH